jgi:hypothetical protein
MANACRAGSRSVQTLDADHNHVDVGRRSEGAAGQPPTDGHIEGSSPPPDPWRVGRAPPAGRPLVEQEVGRVQSTPRCSNRRISADVTENGGLATTWNARRGRRRSAASARTTVMSRPKRSDSARARPGCASTAITRAPVSSSGRVSAPVPAPMSSTRAPGGSAAWRTNRSAQRGSSWCQPHSRRAPTEARRHHHHAHRPSRARSSRRTPASSVWISVRRVPARA